MYVYKCTRCRTKIELHNRRAVPFRSPHTVEGMAPQRCNSQFERVPSIEWIRDGDIQHNGAGAEHS